MDFTLRRPRFTLRVLIVDDNVESREFVRRLLQRIGIAIIQGAAIDGAVSATLVAKPDLILADVTASRDKALGFAREIRNSRDYMVRKTPIILLTASTDRRFIEAARDHGIDSVLLKPVTSHALRQRVDQIIGLPRPFVRSGQYAGPCRRRRAINGFGGAERRTPKAARSTVRF